ncbi:hypothetical protein [Streptomyces atratus]
MGKTVGHAHPVDDLGQPLLVGFPAAEEQGERDADRTVPLVGRSTPDAQRRNVLLPEPDCLVIAKVLPCA